MTDETVTLRSALERLYRCGQKQGWHYDGGAYEEEMEAAASALAESKSLEPSHVSVQLDNGDDQALADSGDPAWWRGEKYGCESIIKIVNEILDGKHREGMFNAPGLNELRQRLIALDVVLMQSLYFVIKLNDGENIAETADEGAARVRFEIAKAAAQNSGDKVSLWQLFMTRLETSE